MKIMILGASGMAGEMLYRYMRINTDHKIIPVCRTQHYGSNFVCDVKKDLEALVTFIKNEQPQVIINCIGVLIKESEADIGNAFFINGNLPRILASVCDEVKAKFIHISTDCVFKGDKGPYNEEDEPTEGNIYGKSKAWGEIVFAPHLTLRTSIIGPDKDVNGSGLFNWLMKQGGEINGYKQVMWNGITTLELAKQITNIIDKHFTLSGLYHLTTDYPVSKYDLLFLTKLIYKLTGIHINENYSVKSNKCLVNNRKGEYNPNIPPIPKQLADMYEFKYF